MSSSVCPCIKSTWNFPSKYLKAKVGQQQCSSVTSGETEALGAHTMSQTVQGIDRRFPDLVIYLQVKSLL